MRKLLRRATDGGGVKRTRRTPTLDERGVVSVEYTVLLMLVALGCAFAVIALGIPMVRLFETQTTWLFLRLP